MVIVAAVQMNSGTSVDRNLEVAGRLLARAREAGAELAVLPENFALMPASERDKLRLAEEPGRGPIQEFLARTASELGLWIVAGTIPIAIGDPARCAAASLVFTADGRQLTRYDKIHLFDVELPGRDERYRESATVRPGQELALADTPAGRLGLTVCYDLRFPELYRELSTRGATLFSVPAAFTVPTGRAHWEVLLRARAIENLCYVVAAAQSGLHENGRETYGDSMVVDPWGRVLTRQPRGSGVVLAKVDGDGQAALRERFPSLSHRRADFSGARGGEPEPSS